MRITITAASRRDEILQRKANYEQRKANNEAIRREQYNNYSKAESEVFAEVEDIIRQELGDNIGELNIRINSKFDTCLEVQIGNGNGGPRRGENASLTWSWTAYLDKNGQIKKESSSWSGLEATTLAQIEDLKQCVQQLEIINNMDWVQILDVSLPNWEDYITDEGIEDLGPEIDFNRELMEADIEEAIGQNILVKSHEGRAWKNDVYFRINRDSGSQYAITEVPAVYVDQLQSGENITYGNTSISSISELIDTIGHDARIRKVNFMDMIYKPVQTLTY